MKLNCLIILKIILLTYSINVISETSYNHIYTLQNYPVRKITKQDNLSNAAINSSIIDSKGRLWCGSWDGLNYFQQEKMRTFTPNSTGLFPSNIILKLLQPSETSDTLWLLNQRGISCIYNDSVSHYLDNLSTACYDEKKNAIAQFKKTVWCHFTNWGIANYDEENDKFQLFITSKELAHYGISTAIDFFVENELLFIYDKSSGIISIFNNDEKPLLIKAIKTPGKNLLAKMFNHNGRLLLISASDNELNINDMLTGELIFRNDLKKISSIDTYNNSIWLGTVSGDVFKLRESFDKEWHITDFTPYLYRVNEKRVKIWEIREYPIGILLISTDGSGIITVSTKPHKFKSLYESNLQPFNEFVRAIYKDKNGLYIGTKNNGLYIIDQNERVSKVENSPSQILALSKDAKGYLWIGYDDKGFAVMDKFNHIHKFPDDFENIPNSLSELGQIYAIEPTPEGDVWLGTSDNGVLRVQITQNEQNQFSIAKAQKIVMPESAKNLAVYAIEYVDKNTIWFGTRGAGLFRYSTEKQKISFHYDCSKSKTNDILSLLYSKDYQQMYVGSSNGVEKLLLTQDSCLSQSIINTSAGLNSNTIHSMAFDYHNDLWLSTNKGISLIKQGDIYNYNVQDGLVNQEFSDGAIFTESNGTFYFGGANGLDIFMPNDIILQQPKSNPVAIFTRLNSITWTANINRTDQITLPHTKNSFWINYAIPFYDLIYSDYTFKYRLKGFEEQWNYTQEKQIRYTNIPAGEYQLELISKHGNIPWGEEIKTLNIIIKPAIYAHPLALLIYAILFIGTILLIFVQYKNKIHKKENLKLEETRRQMQEEKQKTKIDMYQSIIEEVTTPVSLILPSVQLLAKNPNSQKSMHYISSIQENARLLKNLCSELNELKILQNKSLNLNPELCDFQTVTTEVIHAFTNKVDTSISLITKTKITGWVDRMWYKRVVFKLLSTILNNESKDEEINIELYRKENRLEIGFTMKFTSQLEVICNKIAEADKHQDHTSDLLFSLLDRNDARFAFHTNAEKLQIEISFSVEENLQPTLKNDNTLSSAMNNFDFLKTNTDLKHTQDIHSPEKPSILIINSEHSVFAILEDILRDKYNLIRRDRFQQAKDLLIILPVDFIIIDSHSHFNEVEICCKEIKGDIKYSHISIIELADTANEEKMIQSLILGVDSYIAKPFYPRYLQIRIEQLLKDKGSKEKTKTLHSSIKNNQELLTDYVDKHIQDLDLTSEKWAKELKISKSSLYKKTQRYTGYSPHNYILHARVEHVVKLLQDDNLSIKDIFYSSGFSNRSQFYRSFKKYYHITPKEYRQKLKIDSSNI